MAMFGRNILRESEELPVVNHEVTSEEIATQVEDDKLDIIETIHGDDVEEIQAEKEIQDAVEAGATQEEVEALQESFIVLKENKVKEFFAKIWEKIQALWAKIKAFFKHMLMYLRSMFMSAKDFIDKYEKELQKLDSDGKLRDYEYNGFNYKTDTVLDNTLKALDYFKASQNKIFNEYRKARSTKSEDAEYKEKSRVEIIQKIVPSFSDGDEMDDMLYKEIRDGAVNATDTTKIRFSTKTVADRIRKAYKKLDQIKTVENKVDGIFAESKKAIKRLEDKDTKDRDKYTSTYNVSDEYKKSLEDSARKQANLTYAVLSTGQSVISSVLSSLKTAYNEEMAGLKRACAGAFAYARKQQ